MIAQRIVPKALRPSSNPLSAVKLEDEERPLSMASLSHLTASTYSPAMISQMETKVLSALQWKLAPATAARFLDIYLSEYENMWASKCVEEADFLFMRDRLGKLVDMCLLGEEPVATKAPCIRFWFPEAECPWTGRLCRWS
jgi:hypothetical protein